MPAKNPPSCAYTGALQMACSARAPTMIFIFAILSIFMTVTLEFSSLLVRDLFRALDNVRFHGEDLRDELLHLFA